MLKRTTVIRWVTTPTRQSLASSRKRTLRRRPAMAARSVWSGSKSRVIEFRKEKHCGGLPSREMGGSTEPAAVSRPSKGRRPWWVRLDRDLRAGQMLVWIIWEHGRSSYSLLKNRNRARRSNKCPGVAMVSGCRAAKTDTTGDAPGERRAKQALMLFVTQNGETEDCFSRGIWRRLQDFHTRCETQVPWLGLAAKAENPPPCTARRAEGSYSPG
jgi:hypothetical protein